MAKVKIENVNIEDIAYIVPNHRAGMDEIKLRELADSIREVGLQSPIKVCDRNGEYVIVFGHRRVEACKLLNMTSVPAIVEKGLSDIQIAEMQAIENIHRADLNPVEEAQCVKAMMDAGNDLPQAAARLGKSERWGRARHDLLRLSDKVLKHVASGRLPLKHAELISRVGDAKEQENFARHCIGEDVWSCRGTDFYDDGYVRPLEDLRREISYSMCKLGSAYWPRDVKYAGQRPCDGCPDNSNTEPLLFSEAHIPLTSAKGNCTNPKCYQAKMKAWEKSPEKKQRDEKREEAKRQRAEKRGETAEETPQGKGKSKARTDFPNTLDERWAVALHGYAMELIKLLTDAFLGGSDINVIAIGAAWDLLRVPVDKYNRWNDCVRFEDIPQLSAKDFYASLKDTKNFGGQGILKRLWDAINERVKNEEPYYRFCSWQSDPHEVNNVPLSEEFLGYTECLKKMCEAFGVLMPEPPLRENLEVAAAIAEINKARKDELPAVVEKFSSEVMSKVFGKASQDAKVIPVKWRMNAIRERVAHESESGGISRAPQQNESSEHTVTQEQMDRILKGKKPDALAEIEKLPAAVLLIIWKNRRDEIKGDWRRAAICKRYREQTGQDIGLATDTMSDAQSESPAPKKTAKKAVKKAVKRKPLPVIEEQDDFDYEDEEDDDDLDDDDA